MNNRATCLFMPNRCPDQEKHTYLTYAKPKHIAKTLRPKTDRGEKMYWQPFRLIFIGLHYFEYILIYLRANK